MVKVCAEGQREDACKVSHSVLFIQRSFDIRLESFDRYDVKARFWLPKLPAGKAKYKIYFLPTRTDIVSAQDLKTAVDDAEGRSSGSAQVSQPREGR